MTVCQRLFQLQMKKKIKKASNVILKKNGRELNEEWNLLSISCIYGCNSFFHSLPTNCWQYYVYTYCGLFFYIELDFVHAELFNAAKFTVL